ncbi:DegV family protein [Mesobacillus zeae]|uniref:DegV family protein n=1 Tax=Mesobacillus zeae TaxID=1917180 RepID=A0A398B3K3_9BACI|nr:DegV family protein [Mesobacillus zeae]RID84161.1 DegV family protein [Mesobacillus zeae]
MKKIAWVTDSTAYLDESMKSHPDVYQVPMSIIMDGKEYMDGIDLGPEELYSRLKTLDSPPTTSQPAIGAFRELYEKLGEEYDQVISILVSAKLSGTVESSRQAAQLLEIPVLTIDSKIMSYPLTVLIKKGMELAAKGQSPEEIRLRLEEIRDATDTYVLIGSLEQLHRSGRMTGAKFFLGSMLNIKPIISIKDGVLDIKEKARSEKKAKEKIANLLKAANEDRPLEEVWLLYGLHREVAEEWKRELEKDFPETRFESYPLAAVIGVHAGEHTLGLSWNTKI